MLWAMLHDFEGSILTGGYCYIPVPQVNSVSVSVHLMMFPQMQTVVRYLTKCTPPIETQEIIPVSCLLRLPKPRNVQEALRYCKTLLEHFLVCDANNCKHMGKKGPAWVLHRLGHAVLEKLRMHEICHALTMSTNLFSV